MAQYKEFVLGTHEAKRTKTAKEFANTEILYVSNLRDIVNGYIQPLKNIGMISDRSIAGIFSNIEILLNVHSEFLQSLYERVSSWDDTTSQIGDIVNEIAPFLKLYTEYCMNYDNAIALIQKEKKDNIPFSHFLERAQESKRFNGAYITSYLIMPIQRIPRYEMLLGELLKRTTKSHPDFAGLEKSLSAIHDVAEYVDEACIKAENLQKVVQIAADLGLDKIVHPQRIFIDTTDIFIREAGTKSKDQNGAIHLFNNLIIISHKQAKVKPKKAPQSTNNMTHYILDVHLCWIFEGDTIQLATPLVTLYIKFNENKQAKWLRLIANTIEDSVSSNKKLHDERAQFSLAQVNNIYRAQNINGTKYDGEFTLTKKKAKSFQERSKRIRTSFSLSHSNKVRPSKHIVETSSLIVKSNNDKKQSALSRKSLPHHVADMLGLHKSEEQEEKSDKNNKKVKK